MKIVTVVGARPQFIKAAPVSKELRREHQEILVHTGQHYDYEMSRVFFDGLNLPAVDYNLDAGSGTHGEQTGKMLIALERVMLDESPDVALVYGDTNSTLAGALAAVKLHNNLCNIVHAFLELEEMVVVPLHPRTRKALQRLDLYSALAENDNVILTRPVSYLDFLKLERHARMILTDSGGVQKEAYFLRTLCITLREETEWVETIRAGWNRIVEADKTRIVDSVSKMCVPCKTPEFFGDGRASKRIVGLLADV